MIQKINFLEVKLTQLVIFWHFYSILVYRLQVLIDLILTACFNIDMPNTSQKRNLEQNANPFLDTQVNWSSNKNKGDVKFLMKRLKENERKKNNGQFIFVVSAISILVISGIIISF